MSAVIREEMNKRYKIIIMVELKMRVCVYVHSLFAVLLVSLAASSS